MCQSDEEHAWRDGEHVWRDGEHACRPWYIDHASIILSIIGLYFGENNAGIIGTFAHLVVWFVTQDSVLEDYLLISVRLRYNYHKD